MYPAPNHIHRFSTWRGYLAVNRVEAYSKHLGIENYYTTLSKTAKGGLVLAMDVAARSQPGQVVVKDVLGERVQKMFQDFLEE